MSTTSDVLTQCQAARHWVRGFTMFLVQNECTKLTANWLNALATALVAAGVFAPVAALLYGLSQPILGAAFMIALAGSCLVMGIALHLMGRAALGRLRE